MNRPIHKRVVLALAAGACAAFSAGCGEDRPVIDRVQPDYFDKSFFVGKEYLDPSDDPEFYSQATLVDVGYGASQDGLFTSTYAQPLSRVRWVVQEDMLIARLAYEHVEDSDGKGVGKATNDGIVVAAYRILKHFDVQRAYNAATGEESNVVEENAVDRPWHERQFIRVDWSKNLSTDNYAFDTLSMLGVYGGVRYEPMSYYVNDPSHPDAPRFDQDNGYLDVTNKAFAAPQMIDLRSFGWGIDAFPSCWLDPDFLNGAGPAAQCNPVELTIRQAFRRVENTDYEPAHWDGYRFQAFGAFTTDRKGYARNYGMTDTQWHRFINRYNIWQRSHHYADPVKMEGAIACFTPETTPVGADPHRDLNNDGTEDECADAGKGSRCDVYAQKCTLPYTKREVKPVAWYYASGSNLEYFEPTRDATHEWDVALRSAVVTARYSECVRTSGENCASRFPVFDGQQDDNQDAMDLAREVDDCRDGRAYPNDRANCNAVADRIGSERRYAPGVIALAKMPQMIVLCHSPVEAYDPAECGGPRLPAELSAARCAEAVAQNDRDTMAKCDQALNVRRGDLRYHQVNTLAGPQTPSPWGIMVDSNDPLTGETIAASINVWSHVTDLASQGVIDQARYIEGELSTSDVTEGTYVKDWAAAAEAAGRNGAVAPMTAPQLTQRFAELTRAPVAQIEAAQKGEGLNPQLRKQIHQFTRELTNVRADALAPTSLKPTYEARRQRALGTSLEAALTTKMMQSYAGTGLLDSQMLMQLASPLQGAHPGLAQELRQKRELALAQQGACVMHEALAPFAIADFADVLEAKFGRFNKDDDKGVQAERAEKMRRYVARKMHYAVIAHEMGHSIGLRHNFVGSSDAYNFRPQYWQLRTDNGENTTQCFSLDPSGACVGPRWFDPVNDNERQNLITMFMHSTVMDYPGEIIQDMIGLGAYDFAAARMFYGESTSVYADTAFNLGTRRGVGVMEKMDNFGGILGFRPTIGVFDGNLTESTDIHYSQLQREYDLIWGCSEVDPQKFKPAGYDVSINGEWHPVVDGLIVAVGGKYSRCKSQPVDYVQWNALRPAADNEVSFNRGGKAIDPSKRLRVPYGFATDRWADLGNLAVYRHDNGADPYELFDFLITQQEVSHIFDNYRRNRQTFSIRGASGRTLNRYNTKIRDGAKGLGLMANVYREFAVASGYDYETLWPYIATAFFPENLLASGIAFDHFARQMQRPAAGPHHTVADPLGEMTKPMLVSSEDSAGNAGTVAMIVPNGATGYFGNVAAGGRPLENQLASDKGEYDSEYTVNAGSYYDKAWTAMLFTESVDNFISDSRRDFVDSRYRAVSLADLFPDAFRRWLANNLTNDTLIKGVRVETDSTGKMLLDSNLYPQKGLGWTTWLPKNGPEACFVDQNNLLCSSDPVSHSQVIDPEVGWEQQKFLVAMTLMYLPENQQQTWMNMLGIWEIGADSDPGFANRIEFHSPHGKTYVAKTFGKETLFGKTVQKGVAARILEYANELLRRAYETNNGPDLDNDGKPDWYMPRLASDGTLRVRFDPGLSNVDDFGRNQTGRPGCDATDNSECTCTANRACVELGRYEQMPFFMRQAMRDYGMADPSMKGIY